MLFILDYTNSLKYCFKIRSFSEVGVKISKIPGASFELKRVLIFSSKESTSDAVK